jgi:hypothetical protein
MRITFLIAVATLSALAGTIRAQEPQNETVLQERLTAATVIVSAEHADGTVTSGTGWIVHKQKCLIVTAAHVLRNVVRVQVQFAFKSNAGWVKNLAELRKVSPSMNAEVAGMMNHLDFAVLRVAQIPDYVEPLRLSGKVVAPGSALNAVSHSGKGTELFHFERGTVSFTGFSAVTLGKQESDQVRLRAEVICYQAKTIDRGSSGCALVNKAGEVVGLASMNSALKGKDSMNCVAVSIREVLHLAENQASMPAAKPHTLAGRWVGTLQNGAGEVGVEFTSSLQVSFLIPAGGKLAGTFQLKDNNLLVKINGKNESMQLNWLGEQEFRLNGSGMSMVCQRHDGGLADK